MALIFCAITALLSLNFCSGSQSWPELNPELQQYQDMSKVSMSGSEASSDEFFYDHIAAECTIKSSGVSFLLLERNCAF